MPIGSEARRRALLEDLQQLVAAARCTAQLARRDGVRVDQRQLVELLDSQLADLEARALELIGRS